MSQLVTARNVSKRYGDTLALDDVNFEIEAGRIVGLIGPNGAGKTTALKAILGLTPCEGELRVLGLDPMRARHEVMRDVCFIADVAVLPRWLKVSQAVDFVQRVHPRFNRERAETLLARTEIHPNKRVRHLSKGMVTQLHLALIMAIDVSLLVLDEPTLGLDILFRKQFYETLLNDYFDEEKTILVTTHQVEEIENILTDLIFIQHGALVLNDSMDNVAERYVEVLAPRENCKALKDLAPLHEREIFGKHLFLFEGQARDKLGQYGELHTPSIADLFVAKMQGSAA